MKVTFEINEKHVDTIIRALDLYSRICAGQFSEIKYLGIRDFNGKLINYENLDKPLDEFARRIGFGSSSHGIMSEHLPESAKIAYEIRKTLESEVSWHNNPKGGNTVNFDGPLKVSKTVLPKVVIDD